MKVEKCQPIAQLFAFPGNQTHDTNGRLTIAPGTTYRHFLIGGQGLIEDDRGAMPADGRRLSFFHRKDGLDSNRSLSPRSASKARLGHSRRAPQNVVAGGGCASVANFCKGMCRVTLFLRTTKPDASTFCGALAVRSLSYRSCRSSYFLEKVSSE